jgi:chromosome segregation protein
MLKALELVGFKSFATKTRFDFPPGITAVVGPNGSGKSNIVDAVKWVLGEQSVKSLRGKEMTDVIFNGSGSRKAVNSAEVTLTFDNTSGLFDIDSPEVSVTRRVYRSGEGEYLINRNIARLKDIREILAGTGLGSQGYSIIEQGRVDRVLQSSSTDRRRLFEEAAGISRFRTKKLETQRRLERVEQNLLRLSDIVDEVEHRLRSVKMQAGKAQRYRENVQRLQELRTQVGLVDWRNIKERLQELDSEITELIQQKEREAEQAIQQESRRDEIDDLIEKIGDEIREKEGQGAASAERIAVHRATIEHERERCRELEHDIEQTRNRLAVMNGRVGDLQQESREAVESLREAETKHVEIRKRFAAGEDSLQEAEQSLRTLREGSREQSELLEERTKVVVALASEINALKTQAASAETSERRLRDRLAEIDHERERQRESSRRVSEEKHNLERDTDRRKADVEVARERLKLHAQQRERKRDQLARARQRQTGLAERADVLQQLQQRREGFSPGVKDVLLEARNNPKGPFRKVHGVVADLFRVSVESAALIEIVLGEKAQHLVAPPEPKIMKRIGEISERLPGRVGFVWLNPNAPSPSEQAETSEMSTDGVQESADAAEKNVGPSEEFIGRPGVIGRADRFVETDPAYADLAKRLLGKTWIVKKMSDAVNLSRETQGSVAFVTLVGEYLAADGSLVVGPRHAASGLISRRSELRMLESQLKELTTEIEQLENETEEAERQRLTAQDQLEELNENHRDAVNAVGRHEQNLFTLREQEQRLDKRRETLETEWKDASRTHEEIAEKLGEVSSRRAENEKAREELETIHRELIGKVAQLEGEHQTRLRNTTDLKIEMAKSEERLEHLRGRIRQFQESRQERERAMDERRKRLALCKSKKSFSERSILNAEAEMAALYLEKEGFAEEAKNVADQREAISRERTQIADSLRGLQTRLRKTETKLHKSQLAANEARHQRQTLAERLQEDYGTEIEELDARADQEELDEEAVAQREEVQKEIEDLRRKINSLGNVNLDALDELEDLETRYERMSAQYKDLVDAKTALERIIERINVDSRRLFLDSFETIKEEFENLFRDLFGGGQANLVMEEGVDVLDAGVEIVARPPGKELRNISLLSGGEKTLTCVALLLAIFRSRPSPVCILDEVDAALDEANIGRFMNVLHGFLDTTQFIVVTHSKKSMAHADTIYGVTMQESGVSKHVSVRFEEVDEEGRVLPPRGTDAA